MKFKGKVAWWFYAIIVGIAAMLIPIIVRAVSDSNTSALISCSLVLLATELFCIPIALCNFVELRDNALFIRFGLTKKQVQYRDIVSISSTGNPMSSFAASFDRIAINCSNGADFMISVVDKDGFFYELIKNNPHIAIV